MPEPEAPREEALKRLDDRLNALEAATRREPRRFDMQASSTGYQLVAELVGGVLAGLGLGWLVDRLAPVVAPWGIIAGALVGAAASIFLVARSAGRMSDAAEKGPAVKAVPFDDEDEDGAR